MLSFEMFPCQQKGYQIQLHSPTGYQIQWFWSTDVQIECLYILMKYHKAEILILSFKMSFSQSL